MFPDKRYSMLQLLLYTTSVLTITCQVKALLDEYCKDLDAQFLQLITSPDLAGKTLPHISSQVQVTLVALYTLINCNFILVFSNQMN